MVKSTVSSLHSKSKNEFDFVNFTFFSVIFGSFKEKLLTKSINVLKIRTR